MLLKRLPELHLQVAGNWVSACIKAVFLRSPFIGFILLSWPPGSFLKSTDMLSWTTLSYVAIFFINAGLFCNQLLLAYLYVGLQQRQGSAAKGCRRVELVQPIDSAGFAIIAAFFVLLQEWTAFTLTTPLLAYNLIDHYRLGFKVDETQIDARLRGYRVETAIKLIYYFLMGGFYFYSSFWYLIVHAG